MITTLDRFGRIVVPKDIRDRLGLKPGAEMEVDEHGQEIVLRPVEQVTPLKMENGVLVYAGTATGNLVDAVRIVRNERLKKVGGKKKS